MVKAPLLKTEGARLAEYGIPDTAPDPAFDILVRLAADACGAPIALVTLADRDRLWFKARIGVDLEAVPRDLSFCTHTMLGREVMVVPDATQDPRFWDNPAVLGEPHIRFYAGVPLRTSDGYALGTLCVLDRVPRRLTDAQRDALERLSVLAVAQLDLYHLRAAHLHDLAALRQRERELQAVADNVPVLVARIDAQGRYCFANRAYQDLLGLPQDQVLGHTLCDVLGQDGYAVIRPYVERVLAGEAVTYDASVPLRTIGPRFLHGSYVPDIGPDGSVTGFVLSAMDVTDRHVAEDALRESEQRFKSLFENGVNASVCLDRGGRIIAANPPTTALLGFANSDLVGAVGLPFVSPEDVSHVHEILAETLEGRNRQYELHYRHRDGHRILVSGWSIPVMVDGQCTGMYLLARDITAERQAQDAVRRLALIVETSHEAIIGMDRAGTVLSWNGGAEDLYGYRAAEVVGQTFGLLFPPERVGEELPKLLAGLKRGEAIRDFEAIHLHQDGCRRVVSLTISPVRDAAGGIVGHASVVRDITAQKELEVERDRRLAEALEWADRDLLTGLWNHRAFHRRLEEEADRAQRLGQPLAVAMLDLDDFKFFNDAYGHGAGDQVLRQVASAIQNCCRSYDTLARFGGDQFAALMPGADAQEASVLAARLCACVAQIGSRPPGYDTEVPLTLSVGIAVFPDDAATRLDVVSLADARLSRAKTGGASDQAERLRTAVGASVQGFSMLDALVTAVDNKDRYTRRHSEDVLAYSLEIAHALGWDERDRHTVAVAALLHDVGKIGVPDAVLRKPGKLTEAEFEAVRQHPMMGAVMVGAVPGFEGTLDAVRHHHERWDGGGYPFGLRGEAIPAMARLMAVADAFSAMTTDRPYRKGMAPDRALAILAEGAGTQWDPVYVEAFRQARQWNVGAGREMPLAT